MRRFWSDRKANVAVLFAFAIVPMIGAVGAAVDYSLASAYRTDMQKALDATALALSKVVPMEQTQLEAVAQKYFDANFGPHELTNVVLTVTPVQGKLTLAVTGDYTPKIANIFGATQFSIGTSAEAVWSIGKIEIALVLDMSLSMQIPDTSRITALRAATADLLNVLESAAKNPGDAKVAIVPFDGMVNTGYTYATVPSWVRFDWWDANAYDNIDDRCSIDFNVSSVPAGTWLKNYCQSLTSSSCQGAWGNTKKKCEDNGGKWVTVNGVWTSLNRNQWAGCVYDRDPSLNYDASDIEPVDNATYFPAAKCYGTPPQAITPLSENWTDLKSKASKLTPTGYTNITIGLNWGWHTLSSTPVYTQGAVYGTADLNKYVILMTDGYNTKNIAKEPQACPTAGPECPDIDPRTTAACTAIKAAGIKIYTVRLIAGNASLLSGCATSPSMYYDVQSAGQLSGVFSAIGSEIASLHLAK